MNHDFSEGSYDSVSLVQRSKSFLEEIDSSSGGQRGDVWCAPAVSRINRMRSGRKARHSDHD